MVDAVGVLALELTEINSLPVVVDSVLHLDQLDRERCAIFGAMAISTAAGR